jgi:hypothetical protein
MVGMGLGCPIDIFERTDSAGRPFGSINYRRLSEIYGFKTIGIELKKLLAVSNNSTISSSYHCCC